MGAVTLGPIVLSLDRAYAGVAFMVLLLGAEWLSRRERPDLTGWAWRTAIVAFVGARAAFVLTSLDHYLSDPVAIVAIWQGGFAPWWGVAAAAAWSAWEAWRVPAVRAGGPALGAVALLAWLVPAVLLDPAGAVGDALRMRGLPTTLAFDADGRLLDLHVGEISAPTLARLVASGRSSSGTARAP